MKNITRNACLILLAAAAVSCGTKADDNPNEAAKRYFDAWREINYPDAVEKDGIYIIEDKPGTGLEWNKNLPVTFLTYTIRSLSGSVSANTDEQWARKMGTYDPTYYYGQQVIMNGEYVSYAGVDILLDGMREGGSRTAIIPAWLMTTDRYDSTEEYLKNVTDGTAAIYSVTLMGQTENLAEYEYRQMLQYSTEHWGVTDTLSNAAVFFKSYTEFDEEPEEMPTDTIVSINYIGRRISDGQVFDTTIADTAKFYGIYDPSRSYVPVSITWAKDASEMAMNGSNTLIDGFKAGLYQMHADESASFVFGYNLGYGSTGGTDRNMVPPYAALRFDVEMLPQ